MAVSIDALRNIGANVSNFTLSEDGAVQSKGLWHRFMSLFKRSDASAQNAQTLAAIRTAIQSDSRYFADNVQQRATELLNAVRTDRAIGAAKIKSIIRELDSLSTPFLRNQVVANAIRGHVIGRGIPEAFLSKSDDYTELAKLYVFTVGEPQGGWGTLDYGAKLAEFDELMNGLIARMGDKPEDREVFLQTCRTMLVTPTSAMRGRQDCEAIVDSLKKNLDECRAMGAKYGDNVRTQILASLKTLTKPLQEGAVTAIVETGRTLPKHGLDALNANSSADEIHRALFGFSESVRTHDFGDIQMDGIEVQTTVQKLVTQSVVESLSQEAKNGLLSALASDTGKNLLAFYENKAGWSNSAHNMVPCFNNLVVALKTSLGLPDPQAEIDVPDDVDYAKLPPSAIDQFDMQIVTGNGKSFVNNTVLLLDDSMPENLDKPAEFRRKMNTNVTALQAMNLAQQISDEVVKVVNGNKVIEVPTSNTAFDRDLVHGAKVTLPGGKTITQENVNDARDMLTEFVTGEQNAKFAAASPATKMKVFILMASMNQSASNMALSAFGEAFNLNSGHPAIQGNGTIREGSQTYDLSKDDNGNITLKISCHRDLTNVTVLGANGAPMAPELKKGSFDHTAMTITFDANNLDSLANADWTNYEHDPVNEAEMNMQSTTRHQTAVNLIPENFRFTGTVEAHVHMHLIKP